MRPSRAAQACLFSAALVALCGSDFAPPLHSALAAPAAQAATASTLSNMCVRSVTLRRGLWEASSDTDAASLGSTQPGETMPARVCVEMFKDLPAARRWQIPVVHHTTAAPKKKAAIRPAAKPAPKATTHHSTTTSGFIAGGEPCTAARSLAWTIAISQWAVPPGCFGGIYHVNPAAYGVETADYGWCDWWPKAITHNNNALKGVHHSAPRVGVAMWFNPGDQGAGSAGHWAYVESIGPNGWLLISEMNDAWRGGGWAKVNYRYVRVDGGTSFIY